MLEPRSTLRNEEQIRSFVAGLDLSEEERRYARLMIPRYLVALDLVEALLAKRAAVVPPAELALTDVAPHLLTALFSQAFPVRLHTVGAPYRDLSLERRGGEHLDLDLNDAHHHEGWRGFHRADVVFMGEIIEHLHASPRMVMGCASRWVKDGGYLVVQTPNAVALDRRAILLLGRNPYDMIRDGNDPGHFREYTARELQECGEYWQLVLEEVRYANYFDLPHRGPFMRLLYHVATRFPRTLRDGLTLVFRKPEGVPDPRATSRHVRGHLEGQRVEDGTLRVRGWAVDLLAHGPVRLVELVHGDLTFHGGHPDQERPDVVAALGGDARLLRCGFTLECPVPEGFAPERLIARTRDAFGDWYDLPRPG